MNNLIYGLAIDATSKGLRIAINTINFCWHISFDATVIQASRKKRAQQYNSLYLISLIDALCINASINKNQLSYITYTKGPGSFAQLRITASTVKALSLSLNIPVIGIPSLNAMSYNTCILMNDNDILCTLMHAHAHNYYIQITDKKNTLYNAELCMFDKCQQIINKYNTTIIGGIGSQHFKEIQHNKNIQYSYSYIPMDKTAHEANTLAGLIKLGYLQYQAHNYESLDADILYLYNTLQ